MFNYKSRWDATKRAWTEGARIHKDLGLDKSYQNWSPALLFAYQLGVVGMAIGAFIAFVVWSILLNWVF